MKARRKARVVLSEDEQAEEEHGRNLMQDLNFKAQVPPHLEAQEKISDVQISELVEEQIDALSAAKILAESAKKRRNTEGIKIYTRKGKKVSTASREIGTASVAAKDKGKEKVVEEEIQAPTKTKKQIAQEQAGFKEVMRLQDIKDEEAAK